MIDRFGKNAGKYFSPAGTPYEQRSLPGSSNGKPYRKYRLLEDLKVESGKSAPWFDKPGGGTQYKTEESVTSLLNRRAIEDITNESF